MSNIPSAGPWITEKEVGYVNDAVKNGWYSNWSGYLDRFEETFAEYIGVKHAIATSSCTGALHIVLRALGVGPGDEVIVPEVSWIATVSSVCYLGATPVFVDVCKDTWCMDPVCFEQALTAKTKAVIPVDMFGTPSNKEAICRIAKEAGVAVIEDAAPGIGSEFEEGKCGSFGLAGCFSFQGAKPLVTGEGGMLVTDDDEFYEKCYYYWDHCRDKNKVLFNTDIGYKYKMSNIQAALGLAQLERADEIIQKRRQIFFWYQEQLGTVDGLAMNVEPDGCFNNYYVPTIIVDPEVTGTTAASIMKALDCENIGNRPFFRPMSKFPMFSPANTPVADYLATNGVNLPCASMMSKDQVERTCSVVLRVINGGA